MASDKLDYRLPPLSPLWNLPEIPASPLDVVSFEHKLQKRQSLRLRTEEILENAEPPSPLKSSLKTTPQPVNPRMSLFNMFSRPNVERQRSYAEPGIDHAPTTNVAPSKPNLVIQVQDEKKVTQRPASILSGKTTATKWSKWSKGKSRQPTQQPKERKAGSFEPPPLFQAYPQSAKEGTLEVSSISIETLNKAKSRSNNGLNGTTGENIAVDSASAETRRASALRSVANGTAVTVELPRKIFVLVTSGYLLQYAERGSSDRLPEKVLHLGKDSAAFACDLVPEKHYVLQVSQAVGQDGIIVANSGSIFSRLGIRSAAAKRMASTMILVMPNAEEMDSWMNALREEIEALGGKKIHHYTSKSNEKDVNGTTIDLTRTPSQSHRYQVKRDPSRPTSVCSPKPLQTSFPPVLPDIDLDRSERSTLDEIEWEASMLNHYLRGSAESTKTTTESQSSRATTVPSSQSTVEARSSQTTLVSSPTMVQNGQEGTTSGQLSGDLDSNKAAVKSTVVATPPATAIANDFADNTAGGGHLEKVHISPARQTATVPTWKARTSSLGYSVPIVIKSVPSSPEAVQEVYIPTGSPETTTSMSGSHNFSRKAPPPPIILHSQASVPKRPLFDESPIIPNYPLLSQQMSTRLTNAYNERNFPDTIRDMRRHDSKMSSPPAVRTPGVDDIGSEDLFDKLSEPKDATSPFTPSSRTSVYFQTAAVTVEPDKARRVASFSMPLRVNPTATNGSASVGNVRRHSRMDENGSMGGSGIGYALTPPVDPAVPEAASYTESSPSGSHSYTSSNSTPGRLSLFPSSRSSACSLSYEGLRRSPSNTLRQSYSQPSLNNGSLKRPNSLQVRSDNAALLSSIRNSTGSSDPNISRPTIPIRGMKPSRSASNVATLAQQQRVSSIEEFKALKFDTPAVEEEADMAMPLPVETPASNVTRLSSRSSVRKSLKGRSSLPDLDFGLPVVGLGPPAPPPQAPLPAPPPGSRTTSPMPSHHHQNGSIGAIAGLGISV